MPRSTIGWADCWCLTLVNPVRQGSKMVIPIYSPAGSKRNFPLVCIFAKAWYVSLLGFHHSYASFCIYLPIRDGPNLLALVANGLHSQVMKDCSRQRSSSSWVLLWAHQEAVTQGSVQRTKAKSPSPSLPWNGSDCTLTAAGLASGHCHCLFPPGHSNNTTRTPTLLWKEHVHELRTLTFLWLPPHTHKTTNLFH